MRKLTIGQVAAAAGVNVELASLGGIPMPPIIPTPITGLRTIIPIINMDPLTIISIGAIWPCQYNRNLPNAAITTARLMG